MYQALLIFFLFIAICLISVILLQKGMNTLGGNYNTNVANTIFGSSGSSVFMTKMTAILATLFFILSLILNNISKIEEKKHKTLESLNQYKEIKQEREKINNNK